MVKKDIENIIDQNKVINQNNIIDLADYFLNKMNLKNVFLRTCNIIL